MDIQTSEITRGRFARVCIEVDIKKPLPPFIKINKFKQEIAYELNTCFCNKCGVIGHMPMQCNPASLSPGEGENINGANTRLANEWKIIEKKRVRFNKSGSPMATNGRKNLEKSVQRNHHASLEKNNTGNAQQRLPQQQWRQKADQKNGRRRIMAKNQFQVLNTETPESEIVAGDKQEAA